MLRTVQQHAAAPLPASRPAHTRNLSASITLYTRLPLLLQPDDQHTPQLLLLPLAAATAAAAAAAAAVVNTVGSSLLVLLAAQLGVPVCDVDVELVGALHNLLALASRHVVRDLRTGRHTGRQIADSTHTQGRQDGRQLVSEGVDDQPAATEGWRQDKSKPPGTRCRATTRSRRAWQSMRTAGRPARWSTLHPNCCYLKRSLRTPSTRPALPSVPPPLRPPLRRRRGCASSATPGPSRCAPAPVLCGRVSSSSSTSSTKCKQTPSRTCAASCLLPPVGSAPAAPCLRCSSYDLHLPSVPACGPHSPAPRPVTPP